MFTNHTNHTDCTARTTRTECTDRATRTDRTDRADRTASTDRTAHTDRAASTDRIASADRAARTDRTASTDRTARTDRSVAAVSAAAADPAAASRWREARFASWKNYTLALDAWRAACDEAGLAFLEDNSTKNGARKLAAQYLDTETVPAAAIEKAMRAFAKFLCTADHARHYTLNALANNLSRYLEPPKKAATAPSERILWRWTCALCGTDSVAFVPAGFTPRPSPCLSDSCGGTAYPVREG